MALNSNMQRLRFADHSKRGKGESTPARPPAIRQALSNEAGGVRGASSRFQTIDRSSHRWGERPREPFLNHQIMKKFGSSGASPHLKWVWRITRSIP
jgi:hypothetical protein